MQKVDLRSEWKELTNIMQEQPIKLATESYGYHPPLTFIGHSSELHGHIQLDFAPCREGALHVCPVIGFWKTVCDVGDQSYGKVSKVIITSAIYILLNCNHLYRQPKLAVRSPDDNRYLTFAKPDRLISMYTICCYSIIYKAGAQWSQMTIHFEPGSYTKFLLDLWAWFLLELSAKSISFHPRLLCPFLYKCSL